MLVKSLKLSNLKTFIDFIVSLRTYGILLEKVE